MTEDSKIRFLKGNATMQEEFIDFVNYVFHMNGKDNDFYRELPKLFKKEYQPCKANYMTLENDRIIAAVGSYPGELAVGDTILTYYGIGNVAVNPYRRSQGYMKKLINMAVEDMLKEEVDFTVLTGRKNRYSYFSYEIAGRKYCLWMDGSNVKHSNIGERSGAYQFKPVNEEDKGVLELIANLQKKQPFHYIRNQEKLFDILKTWKSDVYAIYQADCFAGYLLLYDNDTVKEILLTQPEKIKEVVTDFVADMKKDGVNFEFPEHQRAYIDALSELAENVSVQVGENFSVFHYKKVIEAFLKLKAKMDVLADGEITLLIHGKKREERLHIQVKDNKVVVTDSDKEANREYSHCEAMEVLFHNYSPLRNRLSLDIQSWLPLPIHIFPADLV